jgi:predicted LPLAT superfamily acyltransferase
LAYSEAQRRATDNYRKKHREHSRYLGARSAARGFIRNRATLDDLEELAALIETRRTELQQGKD